MLVLEERGKPEYPEKNLSEQSREPTTQPTYDAESGNRTRATLVGGECSTTAPSVLPHHAEKANALDIQKENWG